MGFEIIEEFYPDYLENIDIEITDEKVVLFFKTKRMSCKCPNCGELSNTYRTYYTRKVQDLPMIDRQLFLNLKLKKFKCENNQCETNMFTEDISDLVAKNSRRTLRLDKLLTKVSLINSAEEGSRICKSQNIDVSGDTLLRLSKNWEITIEEDEIIAVGVDDFALKKNITMEQLL